MNIQSVKGEHSYRTGLGEEIYWRSDARTGSNKLLIRLRAEFDCNMHPPKGWRKREPEPKVPQWKVRKLNSKHHLNRMKPLQELVAEYFNTTVADLCGPSRIIIHVRPRMIAMYVAKKFTNLSFPKVGSFFGGRDHTTVLNAVRKIEREIRTDADLAWDVAFLIECFTGKQQ